MILYLLPIRLKFDVWKNRYECACISAHTRKRGVGIVHGSGASVLKTATPANPAPGQPASRTRARYRHFHNLQTHCSAPRSNGGRQPSGWTAHAATRSSLRQTHTSGDTARQLNSLKQNTRDTAERAQRQTSGGRTTRARRMRRTRRSGRTLRQEAKPSDDTQGWQGLPGVGR